MKATSIEEFYKELNAAVPEGEFQFLPTDFHREIGHFNVFNIAEITRKVADTKLMPYNRRLYYKISYIKGRNKVEYADKVIIIENCALLFATPKVPYHYVPLDEDQAGFFCVFTEEFFHKNKSGVVLDDMPIFRPDGYPVFQLNEEQEREVASIFQKINKEIGSDYAYKYDLIRTFVLELIHLGQKLQPTPTINGIHNASARVTSLFLELMERQFPIEMPNQVLQLRSPKDFANRLSIHVNHLNKVLKESTGITTTAIINNRILQEAKILLRQTNWNVSEISFCLGFDEVAHFSNFFKKQTNLSPMAFRS